MRTVAVAIALGIITGCAENPLEPDSGTDQPPPPPPQLAQACLPQVLTPPSGAPLIPHNPPAWGITTSYWPATDWVLEHGPFGPSPRYEVAWWERNLATGQVRWPAAPAGRRLWYYAEHIRGEGIHFYLYLALDRN